MKSAIQKILDATTERDINWIVEDNKYKVPTAQLCRLYKFANHKKALIQRTGK
jgi:hypothetical protein